MNILQPVRGTHDLLPAAMRQHRYISDTASLIASYYGYQEIATPIFEFADLFQRTLGAVSDIVSKEMYNFTDRGGDQITLRPENTAGVARAFLSAGLMQKTPCKFFYSGPMFRYERPQKGRLRQFHQIGIELIGVAHAQGDIEIIACAARLLEVLMILPRTVLQINTLGDIESRNAYRNALIAYFSAHKAGLSEDSRLRLQRNPLRILDSKDPGDRELVAQAPLFDSYLTEAAQAHFSAVTMGLSSLDIAWEHNPHLVRGLDYYSHTAFEFVTKDLGAQGTVLAGGRYDGLISQMGGAETPGIGWAAGIERLAMLCSDCGSSICDVALIPVGDGAQVQEMALIWAEKLRRVGLCVDLGFSGNLAKRLKRANRLSARFAVLLGEDELAQQMATVRDLASGFQQEVAFDRLVEVLQGV